MSSGPEHAVGQAFGKIILLGEHAVVHGSLALAAGIRKGARATATHDARQLLTIGERLVAAGGLEAQAFAALGRSLQCPPCSARLALDLPLGVGLGGSAAMGVALARALAALTSKPVATAAILEAAAAWERVFHGNPSGLDAAVAALGGCIAFRRGEAPLPLRLPRPIEIVVAVAGPKASTKVMVERVATLAAREPARFQRSLVRIEELVQLARVAITSAELETLGPLLDQNQQLLAELEVSSAEIENACQIARAAGALGAKLTGAGGGGSVIALPRAGETESVLRALHAAQIRAFATSIEGP